MYEDETLPVFVLLVIVIAPLSLYPTNPPEYEYEVVYEYETLPVFVLLVISTAEVLIPTSPPQ